VPARDKRVRVEGVVVRKGRGVRCGGGAFGTAVGLQEWHVAGAREPGGGGC
jgi:hypothetical protein